MFFATKRCHNVMSYISASKRVKGIEQKVKKKLIRHRIIILDEIPKYH